MKMERPKLSNIDEILSQTSYLQQYIENFLSRCQPTFYGLNLIVKILVHGPDGAGKRLLARLVAKNLNMNFCEERVADMFDENIVGTEKKVRSSILKFRDIKEPCLIYLTGYELFCKLEDPDLNLIDKSIRESLDELNDNDRSQPIVFVGATSEFDKVYRTPLSDIFHYNISVNSPTLDEAQEIIDSITKGLLIKSKPTKKMLMSHCTKGEYYLGNLINLFAQSEINDYEKSFSNKFGIDKSKQYDGIMGGDEDEGDELDGEGTRWADIGGLSEVKQEIIDAIQLSLDFPQLKKSGLRRTGILLYGPPGTGKTLLAKAVATECSLNFISVKGPELLNEYVGQSEENIRKLFKRARESSPSVIFFDELDSLAPNRGQAGDSGGVMDRMVSQILSEMDGVGKSDSVYVIGATNRVDLVDPSLLRPGRFDKVLEVPLPVGKENRMQILKALTRKLQLSDDVDLEEIESLAPENMSGADFQGLCSRAIQRTFDRCVELVESGEITADDIEIVITKNDFIKSLVD